MPADDLPGTLETKHSPVCANASQQSTTAPMTGASGEAAPGLDLRGYELAEHLGGGGMGDVYRAGDPALGRDLAVKVLKAEVQSYASAQRRFLREARVTGSLQHPCIVPIYNLGRLADGRLHYTMRLVRGRTLADILHEEAGRTEHLPGLLAIFEKICQAVAYAHSKRVIHRDLKPPNVMVGRFGEVQVMDWGLAKLLTPGEQDCVSAPSEVEEVGTRIHTEAGETPIDQTRMGREMGTPAYMPPEQALGEWDRVDERADVFALGAILCEMLTGQPPYCGFDGMEALRKAKRGDLAEALAWLEGCGADTALVELCRDCLAPTQGGRPRDAEQVAQRVAAYQAEVQERLRSAELERAAALVKAGEERKRRRWMFAAVVLLLAGVAGSSWQAVRATKAEGQAAALADSECELKRDAQIQVRELESDNEGLMTILFDLDPHAQDKGRFSLHQQEAERLLRQCLAIREQKKPDDWTSFNTRSQLGETLLEQKKFAEAEPLLVQGYQGMKERQDKIPPPIRQIRLNEALQRLVRLYEATDQNEKAADWRKKLEEAKAAKKKTKS